MFSDKLLTRLKSSYCVTVLTGAGISAESGVPTFRGKDGIWKDKKAEEIATMQTLNSAPEMFWEFYNWRRDLLKQIKPNLGHYALVDIENFFEEYTLITQNVDNLHAVAGSKNLVEIHGNITRDLCTSCKKVFPAIEHPQNHLCPQCKAALKPDIVLFGDALSPKTLGRAQEASAVCEVFFSIGTSSLVEPAASFPYIAKGNGAYLVEINPDQTPLSGNADEVINAPASEALTHLVMALDRLR